MSVIIHTIIGVGVYCKVQVQPSIASDLYDGKIRCMYKVVDKTKAIWRYMKALAPQTEASKINWEDKQSAFMWLRLK